jgi:transcriptional regulator with XRE-family HTH domain
LPIELTARKPVAREPRRVPGTWGEHVRRQRILRGLGQKDVAVVIGVSDETVWAWETGHVEPEVHYLPRIIEFLGYCPYRPGQPLRERLRAAREAQGLTLRALARLLHVDHATLWRWESGRRTPNRQLVVVANAILGIVEIAAALDHGRLGRRLAPAEVESIRRLRAEGFTIREIVRRLGVATMTVRKYLRTAELPT